MNAEEKVKLESELAKTINQRNEYVIHKEELKKLKRETCEIAYYGGKYVTVYAAVYLNFLDNLIDSENKCIRSIIGKLSSEK